MNKKKLYINLIANILSFIVQMAISFLLTPIIVNKVGDAAYGFIGLSNNFANYSSILTIVVNSMASRFITLELEKENIKEANKYYSTVFFMNIILSFIIILFSIVLIINLTYFIDIPNELITDVKLTFMLSFINIVISLFSSVFNISTFAKNKLDQSAIRTIIGYVIKVILLIVLFSIEIYFLRIVFGNIKKLHTH